MERKELVAGIKNALNEVTKTVVSAMNELRMSMNERVAVIAKAKRELAEDNETLTDISVAVSDFVEDMSDVAVDLENITGVVDSILYDLDEIPDEIVVDGEDEDDVPDGWVECNDEDFDEEDAIDEIAE